MLHPRERYICLLVICLGFVGPATLAQTAQDHVLKIGDDAPPLRIKEWLKGSPIRQFEKGKVYILEFWATWCKPCVASMPRLSALTRKYQEHVISIAIDIYETKTSIEKVRSFVDSMGRQMDIHVALQNNNEMVEGWIEAAAEKEKGIPITFVVNENGKLTWIGHPKDLEQILPAIVNGTWDMQKAAAEFKLKKEIAFRDAELYFEVIGYRGDPLNKNDFGHPDSILMVIENLLQKEPRLQYTPNVTFYTFSSLLITDPRQAFEYGKAALKTSQYQAYDYIIGAVETYSERIKLPAEIYLLAAQAYQMRIDESPYPELENTSLIYIKIAECYRRANAGDKAIESGQKQSIP